MAELPPEKEVAMETEIISAQCGLPISGEEDIYGIDEEGKPLNADHFWDQFARAIHKTGFALGSDIPSDEIT